MPARRLLSVALGTLLTACSSTPLIDAPPTPAPLPEPTAALVLGDFDPESDFEVFDPCTEIPAAVLAEAGLGELVGEPAYDGGRSSMCSFSPIDPSLSGLFSVVGDRNPRSRLEELGLIIQDRPDTLPGGAYLHVMPGDIGKDCSAAIHTTRGRFVVKYGEILNERSRAELCDTAINTLTTITDTMGEDSGTLS